MQSMPKHPPRLFIWPKLPFQVVLSIESNTSIEQDEIGTTLLICLSVEKNTTLQLLGFSRGVASYQT